MIEKTLPELKYIKFVLSKFPYLDPYKRVIDDDSWLYICHGLKLEKYKYMESVFKKDDFAHTVYFVLKGDVSVIIDQGEDYTIDIPYDSTKVVSRIGKGTSFGELGVLYSGRRYLLSLLKKL